MNDHRTEHDWFDQALAAYLADGLVATDRARFEAHAQSCPACADRLADLQSFDESAMELFESDRPTSDLDERIIDQLHASHRGLLMYIHPSIRKAAAGVAALLALGIMGAVASDIVQPGSEGLAMEAGQYFVTRDSAGAAGDLLLFGMAPGDGQAPASGSGAKNPAVVENVRAAGQIAESPSVAGQPSVEFRLGELQDGRAHGDIPIDNRGNSDALRRGVSRNLSKPDAQREAFATEYFHQLNIPEEKRIPQDRHLEPWAPKAENAAVEPTTTQTAPADRKVIRNGEVSLEVEAFDPAADRINAIVAQHNGYISTTDSEKLPNGKTRGTIVVRISPDRLDALLIDLKAIGELRSQQITAEDVTKKYTDLQSQLRAARAMEQRLLEMIRDGKGELKDILAAEQQLGVTREKIEVAEGEIRYFDSLVALSTLTITLAEKDIQAAATVTETQHIRLRVCSDNVEQLRADVLALVEGANGQIVDATYDHTAGGREGATLTVALPADAVTSVVDGLRKLGIVDSLSQESRRTTSDGSPVLPGIKVDRRDAKMVITIADIGLIVPGELVSMQVAVPDVARVHAELLAQVHSLNGRISKSEITAQDPGSFVGGATIDLPTDLRERIVTMMESQGVVLSHSTRRPEDANPADERVRFYINLLQADRLSPRETTDMVVETSDVALQREKLTASVAALNGRIVASTVEAGSSGASTARLTIELLSAHAGEMLAQLSSIGKVQSRSTSVNEHMPVTAAARTRLSVVLTSNKLLVAQDEGFWASVREGLSVSVAGLLWSLRLVVIGLCFVLPWALIIWLTTRWLRRGRRTDRMHPAGE